MGFEIRESVVDEAWRCTRGHACLRNGGGHNRCRVSFKVEGEDDEFIFVEDPVERSCPYLLSFGRTHVCTCPVRMEIYNLYGA